MLTLAIILLPILGAILLFTLKANSSKYVAFTLAIAEFVLTAFVWAQFYEKGVQFEIQYPWITQINSSLHFGIDGLTLLMLLLTNTLTPIIIYSSFKDNRPSAFYALILLMQFGLVGLFTSIDGLLFYIFWEVTLIPIWFICGLYGTGENKRKINLKFFIYTFFGSLFMLVAFIYVYLQTGSFDYHSLYSIKLSSEEQVFIFWMFFLAFAIKLPIFPFHSWQADTYTMAPTQGSMLLSGIMLKMGVFGIIKYLLPLAPEAIGGISGCIVLVLSIIGIVYASLIAIVQKDIKRLIAFSSMAHVGLIAAGIFSSAILSVNYGIDKTGIEGASIQMLAHGVNIVGLFYVADILIKRFGTRDLSKMGGLAAKAPVLAVLFMIISVGTMAVPLTNAFIGEFLLLKSIFTLSTWGVIFAGLTLILCAVYVTKTYGMSMFGPGNKEFLKTQKDISLQTQIGLGVLAFLVLIFGIFPQPLLNLSSETATHVLGLLFR
ncbi:complex I subunit 4 family protein [Apibacter adventoris]|uniref:complex I subunit 4 family protein n=1 Tax=Apibacter adventoris TaxID=1679466 RepID=UPI000CF6B049|nr:NADH-quinone oxidoreductase subunit M [Apibacter adventoris]PQL92508.1 NADH-quinone oxidoreductase subunit M [Apibacter adventoris]